MRARNESRPLGRITGPLSLERNTGFEPATFTGHGRLGASTTAPAAATLQTRASRRHGEPYRAPRSPSARVTAPGNGDGPACGRASRSRREASCERSSANGKPVPHSFTSPSRPDARMRHHPSGGCVWVTALIIRAITTREEHSNGKMHSTSSRALLRSRASGLPCMQFPLWRLPQQLQLVLLS